MTTDKDTTLPPLPEPIYGNIVVGTDRRACDVIDDCYTAEQMKAYGQASREQALEDAAKFIEGGSFLHDKAPAKLFANEVAPRIRSLK